MTSVSSLRFLPVRSIPVGAAWAKFVDLVRSRISTADRYALAGIVVGAALLSVWNILGSPDFQDDEGTYTAQAEAIHTGNLAPYTYWYDHPPLGWLQLAALTWVPRLFGLGDTYIGAARYVVALYFTMSAVLIYLVARRLSVRLPFALLAVVLFCLSPLSLVLGRQVFLDNLGVPWLLLAFYLVLSPRKALWHHVAAGVFFAVAVLSKETLAIFGPGLLLALVHRPKWSTRTFSIVGFLTTGALILLFYPLSALLRNELVSGAGHVSLEDALIYQFSSRPGSGTVWQQGSARSQLLEGWLYYDKYLIVTGLVAAGVCLFSRRTRWISVSLGVAALPVVVGQGYLPTMYVIGSIPFLVLAIAAAADLGWGRLERIAAPLAARRVAKGLAAGILASGLVLMSIPQWFYMDRQLLTAQSNGDWNRTLAWVKQNIPHDAVVLTPYSMWQDLNASGWNDPWKMIVVEKVDLDGSFAQHYRSAGWTQIQWVIEGPSVRSNIDYLGLAKVREAVRNSEVVQTFGEWRIRKVVVGPDGAAQAQAGAAAQAQAGQR